MENNNSELEIELKYDNPLNDPENDILGRKEFAKNLAKSIIGLNSTQGFVYALYGPWGSGKSTVINFTEHYLKKHNLEKNKAKIVVFKFNPWMFSGSENLTKIYLDQLRTRLRMDDVSDDLKKISKSLELIEIGLSFAKPIGNIIIPGSGSFIEKLKSFVSNLRNTSDSTSNLFEKDLHHLKEDINTALQSQEDKILVIIDDLDRLFDEEIKDFIKMIKAVCDFPKITYLLACDSDKVANALNRNQENNADGYDYLEKIVQCSFNIPRPNQLNLNKLFFTDLDQILGDLKNKNLLFDETDWGNIFHDGVAPCLKTPRNVKTLINSISVTYPAVRDEVNVSDFVGVQVLRVFYPKAYAMIDHNKELLAGTTDGSYGQNHQKELQTSFYDQLHEEIPETDLKYFKALMSRLFPKYSQTVENGMGYGSDWSIKWKQHRKVCSEECFGLYFALTIPDDSFSLQEMQSVIALANNPDELKTKLLSFIKEDNKTQKGRYKIFLGELEAFTEESISEDKIEPLLQAIYDISDQVGSDDDDRGFMDLGISMSMLRISYQLVTRIENEEDRFLLLKRIFENSKSVSLVVDEASLIDSKELKEKDNIVSHEHANALIKLALNKIKEFSTKKEFSRIDQFDNILYRWRDWSSMDEVREYVSKLVKSDQGLTSFLTAFMNMSMSHSMTDRVIKKKFRVSHKTILHFIEPTELEKWIERVRKIIENNDALQSRQKKALEVFIDEKDKPENYPNR